MFLGHKIDRYPLAFEFSVKLQLMLTVPGAEQLLTSHVWTSCVPKLRGNFHVSQAFSKLMMNQGGWGQAHVQKSFQI